MASVELLSPAGGWNSLKAAVGEGADAVYFGLGGFNARRRAENFSEKEFGEVVSYCHNKGVRAYLAANILVKNSEFSDYFSMVERAYSAGVDAVIIQELSFAQAIKKCFPDLGVHASTQAGVFNSYYQRLLSGVDRVILPREFTLNQVKDFMEKTKIPVEVFAQGALCFSVSGQCLFSSFLGGRSGNRGLCAQVCRKKYNGSYLLSARDLCIADKLPEIIKAGVAGIKIEGRLRSPEYVGAATAVYRRIIDTGRLDEDAFSDMQLAFSREYTHGALFKEYDVVTPKAAGKRGIYIGKVGPCGLVKLEVEVRVGDGVGVAAKRGVHGDIIRRIESKGKEVDRGLRGQTVKLFVNAKECDALELSSGAQRRKPVKIKARAKIKVERAQRKFLLPEIAPAKFGEPKLLAKVYSLSEARAALAAGAGRVYYNIFARDHSSGEIGAYVPRCLPEWNAENAITLVEKTNPPSVLCGDLGVASQLSGREIYLDISCNAFNDIDVAYYNRLGLVPVVSPELSFKEIGELQGKRFAVYAHGRIPLMTTRYSLKANALKDERSYVFPVRSELDCKQVLNSVPLGIYSDILRLKKTGVVEYLLDVEENAGEVVSTYRRILAGERIERSKDYTLGNYRKGVL